MQVSGITFGFSMLVVGLSITIGLLVARVLIFPTNSHMDKSDTLL